MAVAFSRAADLSAAGDGAAGHAATGQRHRQIYRGLRPRCAAILLWRSTRRRPHHRLFNFPFSRSVGGVQADAGRRQVRRGVRPRRAAIVLRREIRGRSGLPMSIVPFSRRVESVHVLPGRGTTGSPSWPQSRPAKCCAATRCTPHRWQRNPARRRRRSEQQCAAANHLPGHASAY
jgi:hypothetical protein